ncbi:MAG: NUDIX domain-containing protein [Holophagaceae bacterium]|nr:NUDIX domain-containing protein [Holophagaceae bacterium]
MNPTRVVLGLLRRDGRWFLQRRDPGNPVLPGCWEFPGGKAGMGESVEAALRRELLEELGWEPASFTPMEGFQAAEHRYPGRIVKLHPFFCEGEARIRTALSWGWFTLDEMRDLRIPEANRSLLEHLCP